MLLIVYRDIEGAGTDHEVAKFTKKPVTIFSDDNGVGFLIDTINKSDCHDCYDGICFDRVCVCK